MSAARAPAQVRADWPRRVEPELLDELRADDPRALRSRTDLQRVNRLMGSASILLHALDRIETATPPQLLVELGAGDGSLMLRMARRRGKRWAGARLILIDRQPCVSANTLAQLRDLGLQPEVLAIDVFDWLAQPVAVPADSLIVNLFMHHFSGEALEQLMHAIALRTRAFVCCEPRRSTLALAASHLLGAIGCNAVTRHDAVLSVHAGFRNGELSALWPQPATVDDAWCIRESAAGIFSHLFVASRAER